MCKNFEHYHCALCGKSYPSREAGGKCFWDHTELEILRWTAFELVSCCHFAEEEAGPPSSIEVSFPTKFIKELNERFQVAEIDENGWVWSLAIKGRRV